VSAIDQQIADAVARRDYEAVENLWLELLEADPIPAERLGELLTQLVDTGEGPRALDLALALAPELIRAGRYAEALPLLRAAAPAAPGNEEVRGALIDCYRHVYRRLPHLGPCIDRSALLNAPDLAEAATTLDRLLSYHEGDYFYHASGWGLGRITGFDPLTAKATIDFEHKFGHLVPLETIETIFEPLAPDDFRVQLTTNPDGLRQLANDDPAALVRKAIAANGGRIPTRTLRERLTGGIVEPDAWSKWWTRARAALKRDPMVAIGSGSNALLTLRAEALTYESEMNSRFAALKDLRHQTEHLREYVDHMAKDADPEAFLAPAARTIAARVDGEPDPGAAFEAALLLDRLRVHAGDHPDAHEILRRQDDPLPLLNSLTTTAARSQAIRMLRADAEDWPALCYQILFRGPMSLWDTAATSLPTTGEGATVPSLVRQLRADPKRHLELFAWVGRHLLLERWPLGLSLIGVFEQLLSEGDDVARKKLYQRGDARRFDQDEALALIRHSLRIDGFSYFDKILDLLNEAGAARLLHRIRQSTILPALAITTLERKLIRRYPKLLAEEEQTQASGPDFIYATPESIARRREQHDHLVNVEIPKNSEDIRRAAEMGDISDNADWRAAIQEQGLLNAKAARMADEILRARPIDRSVVSTDRVSIGSRVTIENVDTGETATYAILGPWDSDADRGIIAYLAPLAKAIMRHQLGETATFAHGGQEISYRILSIESALDD